MRIKWKYVYLPILIWLGIFFGLLAISGTFKLLDMLANKFIF